jgi:CheY-like chemotaxis protein
MSRLRILVAEDNEDHLFFITRALKEASHGNLEIESVTDGAQVLDYIHQRGKYADRLRPHLILLDLKMPKVDGLGVLSELKSDPSLRRIPVAVLTSSDRPEDVTATYERGGNTYIVKPNSFADLREWLQAVNDFWTEVAVLPEPPA